MVKDSPFMKRYLLALIPLAAVAVLVAQQPRRVNDAVLKTGSATGEDWVSYGSNWSEQRFSSLKQIDASNVAKLKPAWTYDIAQARGNQAGARQEATPLVMNGVIYSIAPWSVTFAVDGKTGKELWRSDPDVNQEVWRSRICCGVVNRGIALYEGKVIAPIIDGRLRALDMATGKVLWTTRVSPETQPYTITMAPRVIKGGKVIIGVSGGEYGIRGFFAAFDVNTGKHLWTRWTVPGDPSKPFEHPDLAAAAKTWDASKQWWKTGGGAPVWNGFAYDPDADLIYVGTGQPAPWTSTHRGPGDSLYASSILAVKGSTGELKWFYQEVPGDDWDYDSIADIMLVDMKIANRDRKVLMHAPKDGFFYIIDRLTGEVISADPITKISWATGMDAKGNPMVNPAARYGNATMVVKPGPSGGHVWVPWTRDPRTGIVYFPGTAGGSYNYRAADEYEPQPVEIGLTGRGVMNMGTGPAAAPANNTKGKQDVVPDAVAAASKGKAAAPAKPVATLSEIGPDGPAGNVLYAWDPVARKEKWRAAGGGAGAFSGGALATAGNIVFSSVNDKLLAYRSDNGEKLAEIELGVTQAGPPISVMIAGKQYILVSGNPAGGPSTFQPLQDAAAPAPGTSSKMIALTLP